MNGKDFLAWLRGTLIVMLIVFLIVGGLMGLNYVGGKNREKNCARLGEQIGYNTRVLSATCHIEVRPNLWIDEYRVAKFLPLIDCEKGE